MKLICTLIMSLLTVCVSAQNIPKATNKPAAVPASRPKGDLRDTVIEKDTSKENKEPQYFYISANTNVYVNSKGGFAKRFSPSVELGRTYGIFDIGLATGVTNSFSSGSDSTHYIEFRPTINIFSKGRFSEALCLGGGYVFGAQQGLMTEICNSINFNLTEIWAVAVVQGFFYFDGTNSSRNTQYMGLNVTYNFLHKHGTNINRKRAAILGDN